MSAGGGLQGNGVLTNHNQTRTMINKVNEKFLELISTLGPNDIVIEDSPSYAQWSALLVNSPIRCQVHFMMSHEIGEAKFEYNEMTQIPFNYTKCSHSKSATNVSCICGGLGWRGNRVILLFIETMPHNSYYQMMLNFEQTAERLNATLIPYVTIYWPDQHNIDMSQISTNSLASSKAKFPFKSTLINVCPRDKYPFPSNLDTLSLLTQGFLKTSYGYVVLEKIFDKEGYFVFQIKKQSTKGLVPNPPSISDFFRTNRVCVTCYSKTKDSVVGATMEIQWSLVLLTTEHLSAISSRITADMTTKNLFTRSMSLNNSQAMGLLAMIYYECQNTMQFVNSNYAKVGEMSDPKTFSSTIWNTVTNNFHPFKSSDEQVYKGMLDINDMIDFGSTTTKNLTFNILKYSLAFSCVLLTVKQPHLLPFTSPILKTIIDSEIMKFLKPEDLAQCVALNKMKLNVRQFSKILFNPTSYTKPFLKFFKFTDMGEYDQPIGDYWEKETKLHLPAIILQHAQNTCSNCDSFSGAMTSVMCDCGARYCAQCFILHKTSCNPNIPIPTTKQSYLRRMMPGPCDVVIATFSHIQDKTYAPMGSGHYNVINGVAYFTGGSFNGSLLFKQNRYETHVFKVIVAYGRGTYQYGKPFKSLLQAPSSLSFIQIMNKFCPAHAPGYSGLKFTQTHCWACKFIKPIAQTIKSTTKMYSYSFGMMNVPFLTQTYPNLGSSTVFPNIIQNCAIMIPCSTGTIPTKIVRYLRNGIFITQRTRIPFKDAVKKIIGKLWKNLGNTDLGVHGNTVLSRLHSVKEIIKDRLPLRNFTKSQAYQRIKEAVVCDTGTIEYYDELRKDECVQLVGTDNIFRVYDTKDSCSVFMVGPSCFFGNTRITDDWEDYYNDAMTDDLMSCKKYKCYPNYLPVISLDEKCKVVQNTPFLEFEGDVPQDPIFERTEVNLPSDFYAKTHATKQSVQDLVAEQIVSTNKFLSNATLLRMPSVMPQIEEGQELEKFVPTLTKVLEKREEASQMLMTHIIPPTAEDHIRNQLSLIDKTPTKTTVYDTGERPTQINFDDNCAFRINHRFDYSLQTGNWQQFCESHGCPVLFQNADMYYQRFVRRRVNLVERESSNEILQPEGEENLYYLATGYIIVQELEQQMNAQAQRIAHETSRTRQHNIQMEQRRRDYNRLLLGNEMNDLHTLKNQYAEVSSYNLAAQQLIDARRNRDLLDPQLMELLIGNLQFDTFSDRVRHRLQPIIDLLNQQNVLSQQQIQDAQTLIKLNQEKIESEQQAIALFNERIPIEAQFINQHNVVLRMEKIVLENPHFVDLGTIETFEEVYINAIVTEQQNLKLEHELKMLEFNILCERNREAIERERLIMMEEQRVLAQQKEEQRKKKETERLALEEEQRKQIAEQKEAERVRELERTMEEQRQLQALQQLATLLQNDKIEQDTKEELERLEREERERVEKELRDRLEEEERAKREQRERIDRELREKQEEEERQRRVEMERLAEEERKKLEEEENARNLEQQRIKQEEEERLKEQKLLLDKQKQENKQRLDDLRAQVFLALEQSDDCIFYLMDEVPEILEIDDIDADRFTCFNNKVPENIEFIFSEKTSWTLLLKDVTWCLSTEYYEKHRQFRYPSTRQQWRFFLEKNGRTLKNVPQDAPEEVMENFTNEMASPFCVNMPPLTKAMLPYFMNPLLEKDQDGNNIMTLNFQPFVDIVDAYSNHMNFENPIYQSIFVSKLRDYIYYTHICQELKVPKDLRLLYLTCNETIMKLYVRSQCKWALAIFWIDGPGACGKTSTWNEYSKQQNTCLITKTKTSLIKGNQNSVTYQKAMFPSTNMNLFIDEMGTFSIESLFAYVMLRSDSPFIFGFSDSSQGIGLGSHKGVYTEFDKKFIGNTQLSLFKNDGTIYTHRQHGPVADLIYDMLYNAKDCDFKRRYPNVKVACKPSLSRPQLELHCFEDSNDYHDPNENLMLKIKDQMDAIGVYSVDEKNYHTTMVKLNTSTKNYEFVTYKDRKSKDRWVKNTLPIATYAELQGGTIHGRFACHLTFNSETAFWKSWETVVALTRPTWYLSVNRKVYDLITSKGSTLLGGIFPCLTSDTCEKFVKGQLGCKKDAKRILTERTTDSIHCSKEQRKVDKYVNLVTNARRLFDREINRIIDCTPGEGFDQKSEESLASVFKKFKYDVCTLDRKQFDCHINELGAYEMMFRFPVKQDDLIVIDAPTKKVPKSAKGLEHIDQECLIEWIKKSRAPVLYKVSNPSGIGVEVICDDNLYNKFHNPNGTFQKLEWYFYYDPDEHEENIRMGSLKSYKFRTYNYPYLQTLPVPIRDNRYAMDTKSLYEIWSVQEKGSENFTIIKCVGEKPSPLSFYPKDYAQFLYGTLHFHEKDNKPSAEDMLACRVNNIYANACHFISVIGTDIAKCMTCKKEIRLENSENTSIVEVIETDTDIKVADNTFPFYSTPSFSDVDDEIGLGLVPMITSKKKLTIPRGLRIRRRNAPKDPRKYSHISPMKELNTVVPVNYNNGRKNRLLAFINRLLLSPNVNLLVAMTIAFLVPSVLSWAYKHKKLPMFTGICDWMDFKENLPSFLKKKPSSRIPLYKRHEDTFNKNKARQFGQFVKDEKLTVVINEKGEPKIPRNICAVHVESQYAGMISDAFVKQWRERQTFSSVEINCTAGMTGEELAEDMLERPALWDTDFGKYDRSIHYLIKIVLLHYMLIIFCFGTMHVNNYEDLTNFSKTEEFNYEQKEFLSNLKWVVYNTWWALAKTEVFVATLFGKTFSGDWCTLLFNCLLTAFFLCLVPCLYDHYQWFARVLGDDSNNNIPEHMMMQTINILSFIGMELEVEERNPLIQTYNSQLACRDEKGFAFLTPRNNLLAAKQFFVPIRHIDKPVLGEFQKMVIQNQNYVFQFSGDPVIKELSDISIRKHGIVKEFDKTRYEYTTNANPHKAVNIHTHNINELYKEVLANFVYNMGLNEFTEALQGKDFERIFKSHDNFNFMSDKCASLFDTHHDGALIF